MIELILGIGVGAFVVYAAFNIAYLMSLRRTSESVREFLRNTEGDVSDTLRELRSALEKIRGITGNVHAVTEDVREISETVVSLERSVQDLYRSLKEGVGSAAEANIAGLKAGISTGVATLVKNLQQGRSDDHDRGT